MARVLVRRTYPCGYQESVEIEGSVSYEEDDKLRPCRLHGLECRKAVVM